MNNYNDSYQEEIDAYNDDLSRELDWAHDLEQLKIKKNSLNKIIRTYKKLAINNIKNKVAFVSMINIAADTYHAKHGHYIDAVVLLRKENSKDNKAHAISIKAYGETKHLKKDAE